MLRGKKGLVPSNMVELISDPDKLINIQQLLSDQQCRSPGEREKEKGEDVCMV